MSEEPQATERVTPTPPDGVVVESAVPDDRIAVLRVVDAAMLDVDAEALADRIALGDVHVARAERTGAVVGAVVIGRPEPGRRHVEAVAVRRERRGRGIGSALVASAVDVAVTDSTVERVTAAFDPSLSSFYTDLGFVIEPEETGDDPTDDGDDDLNDRVRGVRGAGGDP